ncbi:type IX secretion system membrane protein PorP/SprF [Parabacteroides sp. PF5-6]|uniref:PorP/SprF family type IX secretion system membrane protein n=1 Tax=Parabacteroides sp. PF5-6 TaxID=1742403 RepID=UPI002406504F|nr:type IX secretion system membrane protein PorP/SprF [Parabacteroides sp. PF5-6]MDF9830093.1 type IX secretion system PorP/SprF family membrane protein [Parabacteroides sp. PF5-6]
MKKFLFPIILLWMICVQTTWAQHDAQFSQYFNAMGYYNPAYAGNTEDLRFFGLYRQQWVGIDRAPQSIFAMVDMPFKIGNTNHGVGAVMLSETIGLFTFTHVSGQYAFKKKLWGGELSIGIQAGIANIAFQGDSVRLLTMDGFSSGMLDEAIPLTQVDGMVMDMNAGIFYTHPKFYAGFGVTHLMEPEIQFDENASYYIGRALNFTAGYNIQTRNPLYELQPSVFLKTDMNSFQADLTARVIYNKMFNGGVSWRVNESVVFLLGASIGRFQVGYAYDFPYSPILKGSSGSHELMVRFNIKLKKTQTGNNRHKSVRIL